MLVVTSYEGHTFEQVQNAFCRLVDNTTGAELARYTLAGRDAVHRHAHGAGVPAGLDVEAAGRRRGHAGPDAHRRLPSLARYLG